MGPGREEGQAERAQETGDGREGRGVLRGVGSQELHGPREPRGRGLPGWGQRAEQRGLAREGGVLSEAWAGFLSDQVAPQGHTQACLWPVRFEGLLPPRSQTGLLSPRFPGWVLLLAGGKSSLVRVHSLPCLHLSSIPGRSPPVY